MKNAAKSSLTSMASEISHHYSKEENKEGIRRLVESVMLPRLKGGIQHKEEGRFFDFLHVLIAFGQKSASVHGTFKEVDKLLTPEIVEGLQDLQVHLRTRAMNK